MFQGGFRTQIFQRIQKSYLCDYCRKKHDFSEKPEKANCFIDFTTEVLLRCCMKGVKMKV